LGEVYHNDQKNYRLYDMIPLVIEKVDSSENSISGQILVYVKLFKMADVELSFPA